SDRYCDGRRFVCPASPSTNDLPAECPDCASPDRNLLRNVQRPLLRERDFCRAGIDGYHSPIASGQKELSRLEDKVQNRKTRLGRVAAGHRCEGVGGSYWLGRLPWLFG